jgi:hypothetical protein
MLARIIISWALLGSLIFAAPLNRTTDIALDDIIVSVYNEDMSIRVQGTRRELIANSQPKVNLALDISLQMCWMSVITIGPWVVKVYDGYLAHRRDQAHECIYGFQYEVQFDCQKRELRSSAGVCYCGVHLGADSDSKALLLEDKGSLISAMKRSIDSGGFTGIATGEWSIGTKNAVAYVVDCRGNNGGMENSLKRWKEGKMAENYQSTWTIQNIAGYARYKKELK